MTVRTSGNGFTLIELLVVIAIIGTLASVVLASLNSAREKARDASLASQVEEIRKAMELYQLDTGRYPVSSDAGASGGHNWSAAEFNSEFGDYISPLSSDTWSRILFHTTNGNGDVYGIRIDFENAGYAGSDSNGLCKTGGDVPSGWWGSVPKCDL